MRSKALMLGNGRFQRWRPKAFRLLLTLMLATVSIIGWWPGPPAAAEDVLDQSSGDTPDSGNRADQTGQSFTAGQTGYLNQVDLYMWTNVSTLETITVDILDGENFTGSELATATFTTAMIPYNNNNGGWVSVYFPQPTQVQAGRQYTIKLTLSGGYPQISWEAFGSDVYAGGRFYSEGWNSKYDFAFRTYVGEAPHDYSTSISMPDVTGTYGQTVTFSADLASAEGPLASRRLGVSIDGTLVGYMTTKPSGNAAGTYTLKLVPGIHTLGVSFPASPPYPAAEATATLTVGKASLTVTPNNLARPYGAANGLLTVGYSGLMSWDTAASLGQPILSTDATSASPVGSYTITAAGLTSSKYSISYVPGTLTVTKAPLTVAAADQSRVYGAANPELTGSIAGLVNGETVADSYSTPADKESPAGTYPIEPKVTDPNNVLHNYDLNVKNGKLTVYDPPAPVLADGDTIDSVRSNVGLPAMDAGGHAVVWTSSNNSLLDDKTGEVNRPSYSEGDANVRLEAAVEANGTTYRTAYVLKIVAAAMSDEEAVARDLASLAIGYAAGDDETRVSSGLTLPNVGTDGSSIVWSSSSEQLINPATGAVSRPTFAAGNQSVTLTATATRGPSSDSREYHLIVLRQSPPTSGNSGSTAPTPPSSFYIDVISNDGRAERIVLTDDDVKAGVYRVEQKGAAGRFELNGEVVQALLKLNPSFALDLSSTTGRTKLPLTQLGASSGEDDVSSYTISFRESDAPEFLASELNRLGGQASSPVVRFQVSARTGEEAAVEVDSLGSKAERYLAVPSGDEDGDASPFVAAWNDRLQRLEYVPTRLVSIDGKTYAKLPGSGEGPFLWLSRHTSFSDMQKHWAKKEAETLASMLIIEGTGEGRFDPNGGLTRAETAALLVRALGIDAADGVTGISDISGKWYEEAVASAFGAGLVTGYEDGTFRPNDHVTREELAVILARAIAYDGGIGKKETGLTQPRDANEVSGWAAAAVKQVMAEGIVQGDAGGNFRPKDTATRADMAVMLSRLLQALGYR